jgi:hypothetical protein
MAAIAFRSALDRCGLSCAGVNAIYEEGYMDMDHLDLATKETIPHILVITHWKRGKRSLFLFRTQII